LLGFGFFPESQFVLLEIWLWLLIRGRKSANENEG
jgi:hypothetical protein